MPSRKLTEQRVGRKWIVNWLAVDGWTRPEARRLVNVVLAALENEISVTEVVRLEGLGRFVVVGHKEGRTVRFSVERSVLRKIAFALRQRETIERVRYI